MSTQGDTTGKIYKRVMVIDDNPIDRYVAEVTIKKAAFSEDVICKESAMSALEYLQLNAHPAGELPELIFLDINMPEMNGFEFLEQFAALPEYVLSTCGIMMLSSSIDPQDQKRVAANKFVSLFLNKPLRKEKLSEILNRSLVA